MGCIVLSTTGKSMAVVEKYQNTLLNYRNIYPKFQADDALKRKRHHLRSSITLAQVINVCHNRLPQYFWAPNEMVGKMGSKIIPSRGM